MFSNFVRSNKRGGDATDTDSGANYGGLVNLVEGVLLYWKYALIIIIIHGITESV